MITLANRNNNSENPVLGPLSVREDELMDNTFDFEEVEELAQQTGNETALERDENYSGTLRVFGEEGEFFYELTIQEHTGPDWGKKDMGATDSSHSASTTKYTGKVPENTAVYQEALDAEQSRFR